MKNTSEKILNKIKEHKIVPKPKWHFWLRWAGIWLACVVSIFIGSKAFAVILYRLVNNDWDAYQLFGRGLFRHAFISLPYIWLVIMAVFVALAYYNARHTKKGYRYHAYWFVLGSVLFSMVLGAILYAFGFGSGVDRLFADRLPGYGMMIHDREKMWLSPGQGFLAGEIVKSNHPQILVEDFEDQIWNVDISDAFCPPHIEFEPEVEVRIHGEVLTNHNFKADKIMPWHIGPSMPGFFKGRLHKHLNSGFERKSD